MGIVHDALRRDLRRTRAALTSSPFPDGARRTALAAHLDWMMRFLHAHHGGEDAGLYPMVRAADPSAATLLDAMAADHGSIDPAMEHLTAATQRWGRSGGEADRIALGAALDALGDVLLPHLEREETQAMPLVSATLTHRQWHEWDQTHNIGPKSLPVLAEEGLWRMDDLDEPGRQVVLHEVPLIPRLIVLYGFGARYRRHAAERWGARSPAVNSNGSSP
ncbi:hemerythrin domain-containing protein [Pseudonocardia sp. GCM10023141]|uniref:hemerythrin domain-containing protein n=1 Tax=Pseudonocardia sp. GCM10023141 TaxID=3252653 RepID=UPI003620DA59